MKKIALLLAVLVLLAFCDAALASGYRTQAVICVIIHAPSHISMNLEDDIVARNNGRDGVEAFSELKETGIMVEKVDRDDKAMWLFTKTE
ncbi:MAG: hypothetical protein JW800_05000 [Candidatus Omnitrophica bacterium]|nr:hypothetical protein [Candidatus Omnitrophota bacterium]